MVIVRRTMCVTQALLGVHILRQLHLCANMDLDFRMLLGRMPYVLERVCLVFFFFLLYVCTDSTGIFQLLASFSSNGTSTCI